MRNANRARKEIPVSMESIPETVSLTDQRFPARGREGRVIDIATRPERRAPMVTFPEITITQDKGLAGDHKGRPGLRQVSILFVEDWQAAIAKLDPEAPWTIRRANLLLSGLVNPRNAGARLRVGTALLETTAQTYPCQRMEDSLPGLLKALALDWRGGCLCRVIKGGISRSRDTATFEGDLPPPREKIHLPG